MTPFGRGNTADRRYVSVVRFTLGVRPNVENAGGGMGVEMAALIKGRGSILF